MKIKEQEKTTNSYDAKDVLQNSFMKIFTSLPTFEYRDESSFRNWMIKVVVNEALHFYMEHPWTPSIELGLRLHIHK